MQRLHSLGAVAAHSRSPHSSETHPKIFNLWCVVGTLLMGPISQQVTSFDGLPLTLWVATGWTAHSHLVKTLPGKYAEDSTQHPWHKPMELLEPTLFREPNNELFAFHYAHGEHKVFVALAGIEVLLVNRLALFTNTSHDLFIPRL